MYSRRNCFCVAGVAEDMTVMNDVILDIARKLDIPMKREELTVSHHQRFEIGFSSVRQ